jgi:hypothetical protein
VPILVGQSGQRLYPLETRGRADHRGCQTSRHVPEERSQPAEILQEMRRPSHDQSSAAEFGGRICCDVADVEVQPGVHVNYGETVLPIRDGLPKLKDFPEELGGSGEVIPE